MRKLIVGAVLWFAVLASGVAHANVGYVCDVRRGLQTVFGSAGFVMVRYFSASNCGGTFQGIRHYCSPGATNPSCASSAYYLYAREDLNTFMTMFLTASSAGTKVDYYDTTCVGAAAGTVGCGGWMYFEGSP